jgi:metal-responsive CopG/Arc/MetJ family transcriptional regulator
VRVKTSITLPQDLLARIDRLDSNRSAFVERAARAYLARLERARREARDIEIINRNAGRLNAEAMDVLEYQRVP